MIVVHRPLMQMTALDLWVRITARSDHWIRSKVSQPNGDIGQGCFVALFW